MQKLRQNSDFVLAVGLIGVFVPLIVFAMRHQFNIWGQVFFVFGFICLGLYVGLEYQRIASALSGRRIRYGGNALLMTVLFIGIIAIIAFMSQRYFKRIDLTANRTFSISEQTGKVIDNLAKPVKIWAFVSQQSDRATLQSLLKTYQTRGKGKVSFEVIDTDARPTAARQYGLQDGESDVLVLESGDRRQKVTGVGESDITGGLVKLANDKQKVVYLLTGHGEYSPDDTGQAGILMAKQAIEADNYVVKSLNLIAGSGVTPTTGITSTAPVTVSGFLTGTGALKVSPIPADASVLLIVSPQSPIFNGEWQVISEWLNKGGKVYLLVDALEGPSGLDDMLLANWGLTIRNDLVIDPSGSFMGDAGTLIINRGSFSTITKNMRTEAVLPGARSIAVPKDTVQGTTVTAIAATSDQSWGETDLANISKGVRPDTGKDAIGPLVVAVSIERDAPDGAKSRLAVYGNARFATDRWIQTGGNLDFFVNTVNWLAEDEQLISIRARAPERRTLFIPPAQARLIAFGSALGLPLLVLAIGGLVWWRRR